MKMISFKTSAVLISSIIFVFVNSPCHARDCVEVINEDIFRNNPIFKNPEDPCDAIRFIFKNTSTNLIKFRVSYEFLEYLFQAIFPMTLEHLDITQGAEDFCVDEIKKLYNLASNEELEENYDEKYDQCMKEMNVAEFTNNDIRTNLKLVFMKYQIDSKFEEFKGKDTLYFQLYILYLQEHHVLDLTKLDRGKSLSNYCAGSRTNPEELFRREEITIRA